MQGLPQSKDRKDNAESSAKLEKSGRDVAILAVSMGAILLFAGNGSSVVPQAVRYLQGVGLPPDRLLSNALLLNIALIIFGWRRYRDLAAEVQERSKAEAQARNLAETDALTGCLNRRSMGSAIEELRANAARRGEQVAVIALDLDNFKRLNDFNGHMAGDAVLGESARRMRLVLPESALLARLGGDEFACALAFDSQRPESVERIAERLIEAIAHPVQYSGGVLDGVTVSLGLSCPTLARGAVSATVLLHTADIAMYHAKKAGKNRYMWFDPQMEAELRFRSDLEAGIRAGVALGEFVPFYEPQVDLETGHITGFEMLARWQSPSLGLVFPNVFIPVAEEIGMIADLSESVIRQALSDAKTWDPELTLSVNISPVQLRDPWFAQKLLKMLVEANFPPNRLEIEITESCMLENVGLVRTLVTSLKNQGVRISLDDFGTGYSSLSHLRSLPFDRIKIDRSFVSGLTENNGSLSIVQSIIALGEGLGLPITAEGVENEELAKELRSLGDLKVQGYHFGKPASGQDVFDRLAALGRVLPSGGVTRTSETEQSSNAA